ncbi:ATP-binding protein [Streptomyces noursei]
MARRARTDEGITVSSSPSAAPASYERGALLLHATHEATPFQVRVARNDVSRALRQHGIQACLDDAPLLVSELVTNALRHSHSTGISVSVRSLPERLVLTVGDKSPVPPRRRRPTVEYEHGRGLLLLDLLADEWGVGITRAGTKVVWCHLALTASEYPRVPAEEATA